MTRMKLNVCVIGDIPSFAVRRLHREKKANIDVSINNLHGLKRARDAELLVTRYTNRIDRDVLDRFPKLEAIVQASTGTDNIDLAALSERDIQLLLAEGGSTVSVAEHVIMYALSLLKYHIQSTLEMRNGVWAKSEYRGRELFGTPFGIVGFGRIGKKVAFMARHFGCKVYSYDPYVSYEAFEDNKIERCGSLEQVLGSVRVVSLHVPLTQETEGMIGDAELKMLPKGSFLINTSRGGVVDEVALDRLLENSHIAGAAIDVFSEEPYRSGYLCRRHNVLCSPHIAGLTEEALNRVSDIAVELVHQWIKSRLG